MLCVTWWGEDEKGFLKFSQKYFSIVSLPPSPTFFSIFLPTFPKRCWIWSWKNIDSFFILSLIPSLSTHTNFPLPVHDWKRYNSAPDVWAEILLCETLKRALSWGSLALCWKTNLLLSADSGLCSLWVFVEWQWVNNCGSCPMITSWSCPTSGCCLDLVMGLCRVCHNCVPWLIAEEHMTNVKAERWA